MLLWRLNCPLSSLHHHRWFRPALLHPWFPCPALRRPQILQCPLLGSVIQCPLLENSRPNTHPPAPASSTADVWQPLCSPSAHHLCGASSAGLPTSSDAVVGVSLDSASEARTPPRPVDPSAPPWFLAPSSPPWPGSPPAPPGSLVPPAPPWSGVIHPAPRDSIPPASPHSFVPPAPSGSFIPSAPPLDSVALAPPWPPGSTPLRRSPAPSVPPRTSGSSPSPLLCGSLSLPQAPPPPAPPPLVAPWSRRPSLHHGSSLRRLHRGPPSWLWPGSSLLLLLRIPPVSSLAPPSVTSLVSVSWPPPGCSSSSWTSALVPPPPLPLPLPLPSVFHGARTHLPGGGSNVTPLDCFVVFLLPMCSLWPSFSPVWLLICFQVCLVFLPDCPVYLRSCPFS